MKTQRIELHRKHKARNHAEHLVATRFKPGPDPRRNPGGKSKIHLRMATLLLSELGQPAPKELSKAYGLRGTRTKFEVAVAAAIHRAMTTGDPNTLLALHDLTEGKLPNKNYNLSVEMQAYMDNPNFRAWLATQHVSYMQTLEGGELVDDRSSSVAAAVARRLRGGTVEDETPTDR